MESYEKKRLVFDVTEEEYEEFMGDAKEIGSTKIGLLRRMWITYRMMPHFGGAPKKFGPTTKFRHQYLSLAFSILNMLSVINQRGKATLEFVNTAEQDWELWTKRLHEVIDRLEAVPPNIPDDDFIPPIAPEWFGIGRIIEKLVKNNQEEQPGGEDND